MFPHCRGYRVRLARQLTHASPRLAPDFAAGPAGIADADRTVHRRHSCSKGVHAFAQVGRAKEAAAERTLEAGMGATAVDAAQAGTISTLNALAVFEMEGKVVALSDAGFARADGFVAFDEVGVFGAERAAAILALVHRWVVTVRKTPAQLAVGIGHRLYPFESAASIVAREGAAGQRTRFTSGALLR